ncbi:MAG: hypothetical protein K9N07_10670 [Candidatus Cloacimonetes bacterium]|nr:hypothetical protein [Candidatus Cloacimonadota bacterium]
MFLIHLLFALILSIFFTAIFAAGFRRHRSKDGLVFYFIILFITTWAIGLWISPFGPMIFGAFILPFLISGFLFALLLAALMPPFPPSQKKDINVDIEESKQTIKSSTRFGAAFLILDFFFWIFIIGMIIIIFSYYIW